MFDNIIGQRETIQTLAEELSAGALPGALLFHGPRYSAKLSTALEVARLLTCTEAGEWSCLCPSCRKQRLLIHPNALMLGPRYFSDEIAAAADVLLRSRRTAAQYLFVRAVRKLTRRFDPVIWEGMESRLRAAQTSLAEVEERLDELAPEQLPEEALGGRGGLEAELDRIGKLASRLVESLPTDTIPIDHLRNAVGWLHMTSSVGSGAGPGGTRKIVVLENADRMHEASSNSLLKLLEEPPEEATLILLTGRREALIPTVLSRLRPYAFHERGAEETVEVLTRVFREEMQEGPRYESLREYFLYQQKVNPDQLHRLSHGFIAAALEPLEPDLSVLEEIRQEAGRANGRSFLLTFLEELLIHLRLLLLEQGVSPFRLGRWNEAVRRHQEAVGRLNQNPQLALESLFYSLRALP